MDSPTTLLSYVARVAGQQHGATRAVASPEDLHSWEAMDTAGRHMSSTTLDSDAQRRRGSTTVTGPNFYK